MIVEFTPTLSPIIGWDYVNVAGGLKDATLGLGHRAPSICAFGTKIYVAWCGNNGSTLQRIYVSEYDPATATWTRIDPGGATGLNFAAADFAQAPHLFVFNSKLYCTWDEGGTSKIRVKVWSGSGTTWTFVDGNTSSGLNKATNRIATTPMLAELNSKLYVTWNEAASAGGNSDEQIRCRVYNGNDGAPAWTFVDGNLATGLNKSTTERAFFATPVVSNSKLYITWLENNGSAVLQLRCKVYNGNDGTPVWTFVDGNGANGLNYDTTKNVGVLSNVGRYHWPAEHNGKLYILWNEGGTTVRLKVYNGNDGAPSWSFVDGNTAAGFNFSAGSSTTYANIVSSPTWDMHLIWGEGASKLPRVSVYNGVDSSPKRVDTDTSATLTFNGVSYSNGAFQDNSIYIAHVGTPTAVYVAKARV